MDATNQIFALLRDVIPNIPESCTKLTLRLEVGTAPLVELEWLIKDNISFATHEQHFTLVAVGNTLTVR